MPSRIYQTRGLILSSHDFREADKIFSIYTDTHGKIEALATGVRKIKSKLRAHLEPFSVVTLMLAHGRRHDRLASAINIVNYRNLKSDYNKVIFTFQILELIDQLTKLHHPDPHIFNLAKETFEYLESHNLPTHGGLHSGFSPVEPRCINVESLQSYFTLNFLSLLGYTPELQTCVRCRTRAENLNYFSPRDGSVICGKCVANDDIQISSQIIEILKKYLTQKFPDCIEAGPPPEASAKGGDSECHKIIKEFLNYHLDRPLKSEFLK